MQFLSNRAESVGGVDNLLQGNKPSPSGAKIGLESHIMRNIQDREREMTLPAWWY